VRSCFVSIGETFFPAALRGLKRSTEEIEGRLTIFKLAGELLIIAQSLSHSCEQNVLIDFE
jgi:hypothetical protein